MLLLPYDSIFIYINFRNEYHERAIKSLASCLMQETMDGLIYCHLVRCLVKELNGNVCKEISWTCVGRFCPRCRFYLFETDWQPLTRFDLFRSNLYLFFYSILLHRITYSSFSKDIHIRRMFDRRSSGFKT